MSYALLTLSLMSSTLTFAADASTYQVTGPVVEIRDDFIVLQKGKEHWAIARDLDTRGGADISIGDTVTVQYTMNARAITKE